MTTVKESSEEQEIMTRLHQVKSILSEVEKLAIPLFPKAEPDWCEGVREELRKIVNQTLSVMEPFVARSLRNLK